METQKGSKSSGIPEERGSVEDSGKRAGETHAALEKKKAERLDRREIAGEKRTPDSRMMLAKEFCRRLSILVNSNYVVSDDPPQIGNDIPEKRVAAMQRAIKAFGILGVDRKEFLKILEWLLPAWEKGLKRVISDRPFSILTLYYRSKQILAAYRSETEDDEPEEDEKESEEEIRKRLGKFGKYY